jgi:hypothetical protein
MGFKEAGLRGSLRNVSVGVGIPDSGLFQVNAQNLSGYNDADTVSTWPDEVAGNDASATGDPVYRASAINGYPAVELDGTDDYFAASVGTYTQPYTIFTVLNPRTDDDNQVVVSAENDGGVVQYNGSNWLNFSGTTLDGSTTFDRRLLTVVSDGTNSVIREDGTETASGDAGTFDMQMLTIGRREGAGDLYSDAQIGLVETHDGRPSNGLQTREQEIAGMWDITL